MTLAEQIISRCTGELGFAAAGVCEARPSDHAEAFGAWLARGEHGSMAYLEARAGERLDPRRVLPGARSIIMVADQYAVRDDARDPPPPPGHGRIARYARGRDYHRVIKKRLHALCDDLRSRHPDAAFRAFVDTAPVMEREHAARAGLGWTGKHTLTIHPTLGSYILLGGVLTTLELEPPDDAGPVADHCGTCTRCIDACPTDAITPYSVNASRCISYLTIERRAPIDPSLAAAMGDWVFGCDICQEVCPHNSPKPGRGVVHPDYAPRRASLDLLEVLGWTEADRRRELAGTAMTRAKLDMLKRNAAIAIANAAATQTPDSR